MERGRSKKEVAERFSISLPPQLLSAFDEFVERRGQGRSECIRDLIRQAILDQSWGQASEKPAATLPKKFYKFTPKPNLTSTRTRSASCNACECFWLKSSFCSTLLEKSGATNLLLGGEFLLSEFFKASQKTATKPLSSLVKKAKPSLLRALQNLTYNPLSPKPQARAKPLSALVAFASNAVFNPPCANFNTFAISALNVEEFVNGFFAQLHHTRQLHAQTILPCGLLSAPLLSSKLTFFKPNLILADLTSVSGRCLQSGVKSGEFFTASSEALTPVLSELRALCPKAKPTLQPTMLMSQYNSRYLTEMRRWHRNRLNHSYDHARTHSHERSKKDFVAVFVAVFDHHQNELLAKKTSIEHDANVDIIYTTHIHIDHHNCLETSVIRSFNAENIENFCKQISLLRGIKFSNIVRVAAHSV